MRVRRWMKRIVILGLLLLGLLFWGRLCDCSGAAAEKGGKGVPAAASAGDEAVSESGGDAAMPGYTGDEAMPEYAEDKAVSKSGGSAAMSEIEKRAVKGRIALTFDDGPDPRYTERLLDGLKERGVKATFFVTGANVSKYPEIVKRMQEEGHLIGNHTYHHIQLTSANGRQFKEEIISTNDAIRQVTGEDTEYIRPPYGSWNKKYEEELNMFPVLWTVDPRDWCSDNIECIVSNTVNKIKEGDIILMHDQYETSVIAAMEIIDRLQEEGYEFVTVEELLLD